MKGGRVSKERRTFERRTLAALAAAGLPPATLPRVRRMLAMGRKSGAPTTSAAAGIAGDERAGIEAVLAALRGEEPMEALLNYNPQPAPAVSYHG